MAKKKKQTTRKARVGSGIPDFTIGVEEGEGNSWKGLITAVPNTKALPPGAASDSNNWLTGRQGDHIELRRGYALLGVTRNNTAGGKITGLGITYQANQTQIPFYTYARALAYYDPITAKDIAVINANQLPLAAKGEDVAIRAYNNIAGFFAYLSSPNSSAYKIPTANPTSVIDLAQTSFKGLFSIKENRVFLWNKLSTSVNGISGIGWDRTGIYLSHVDKTYFTSYTQTTGESYGTGDGATKTFPKTLANVTGVRTAFAIQVTDGVETFTDDQNGVMVGSLGGTGTVNYKTGAVSVTFNTAPLNLAAITSSYYYEDSTSGGIWDFSITSPTRKAGDGQSFRQDDGGGNLMAPAQLNNTIYCIHQYKTWALTTTVDDTQATNYIYRTDVGIPYWRAMDETADGIPYVDISSNKNSPQVRRLEATLSTTGQFQTVPTPLSEQLDLSNYDVSTAVVKKFGDLVCVWVQSTTSNGTARGFNDTLFTWNIWSKQWDKHVAFASCAEEYNNTLLTGDSITNNLFTMFSGFVDDGSNIINQWISGETNLNTDGRKRHYRGVIDGLISINQAIQFWISYDNANYILFYTQNGADPNVDFNNPVTIGSTAIGAKPIGDGSPSGGSINAYHYRKEIILPSPIFEWAKLKIVATNVGWAQVNFFKFKDVRYKGRRVASQYMPKES